MARGQENRNNITQVPTQVGRATPRFISTPPPIPQHQRPLPPQPIHTEALRSTPPPSFGLEIHESPEQLAAAQWEAFRVQVAARGQALAGYGAGVVPQPISNLYLGQPAGGKQFVGSFNGFQPAAPPPPMTQLVQVQAIPHIEHPLHFPSPMPRPSTSCNSTNNPQIKPFAPPTQRYPPSTTLNVAPHTQGPTTTSRRGTPPAQYQPNITPSSSFTPAVVPSTSTSTPNNTPNLLFVPKGSCLKMGDTLFRSWFNVQSNSLMKSQMKATAKVPGNNKDEYIEGNVFDIAATPGFLQMGFQRQSYRDVTYYALAPGEDGKKTPMKKVAKTATLPVLDLPRVFISDGLVEILGRDQPLAKPNLKGARAGLSGFVALQVHCTVQIKNIGPVSGSILRASQQEAEDALFEAGITEAGRETVDYKLGTMKTTTAFYLKGNICALRPFST